MRFLKCFCRFSGRLARRALFLVLIPLAAVLAGFQLGRYSVLRGPSNPGNQVSTGSWRGMPGPDAATGGEANAFPSKALNLRHRMALLMDGLNERDFPTGFARLQVELHDLSDSDLRTVLKIAQDWPGGVRGALYHEASSALAWRDPEAALEDLLRRKPGTDRSILISEVMALWARRDPEAAWKKWMEKGLGRQSGSDGLESIVLETGRRNPSSAFAKLRMLEKSDDSRSFTGIEMAASSLCQQLADSPQRQSLLDELLISGTRVQGSGLHALFQTTDFSNPDILEETQEWMRQRGITGGTADTMYSIMLRQRMTKEDPEALAAWYQSVSGKKRPGMLNDILSAWSSRDLNAAGEWLNLQMPGPELDPARFTMTRRATATDLEAAFSWAAAITDRRVRLTALQNVWIEGSRRQSSADVQAAIRKSHVSAEDQQTTRDAVWPWH